MRDVKELIDEHFRLKKIAANDLAYRIAMFNNGRHPDGEQAVKLNKEDHFALL